MEGRLAVTLRSRGTDQSSVGTPGGPAASSFPGIPLRLQREIRKLSTINNSCLFLTQRKEQKLTVVFHKPRHILISE